MIVYKKASEIEQMRRSGKVVAHCIRAMHEAIVPGKSTPKDLDKIAARIIEEAGGVPSFLNYRGYPASTCISVNEVVIHGIPDDRPIVEGDIVDLDVGVCIDGWHADAAWTFPIGSVTPEAQRLLNVARESLSQGIAKAKVGNRLGDIGAAVQKYVEQNGNSLDSDLVGHGIGRSLHDHPHDVPNFGKPGTGLRLQPGLTICIEPMVNEGGYEVETLKDGWTIVTADGSLSAHFEHTIAVTKDGPDILTLE